jgi:RHS repeat-associated protein
MMQLKTSSLYDPNSVTFSGGPDANGNITDYLQFQVSNFTFQVSTVAHYEYSPFGQITFQSGEMAEEFAYRYSTKYTDDATGLIYFGYRYYDPEQGRFISKDPIQEKGGKNLYGFCRNNGIMRFDKHGLVGSGVNTNPWTGEPWTDDYLDYITSPLLDLWMRLRGLDYNAVFFYDWLFNQHEDYRTYKDGDNLTELLKKSHGIEQALKEYKQNECPATWKGEHDTMQSTHDIFLSDGIFNPAEVQIGGYQWKITKIDDKSVSFHIVNNAYWGSFLGQSTIAGWRNDLHDWFEGVVNPDIDKLNNLLGDWILTIPNVEFPQIEVWPIHTRDDVFMGGNIKQVFDFTMPNPCCVKESK